MIHIILMLVVFQGPLVRTATVDYEPIMITELWRHGARSPSVDTFKQDYFKIEGSENLVGNGMRMHYLLGQKIRSIYQNTLFKEARWSDYKVLSTNYQRTILSAYSHMMGVYPQGTGKTVTRNGLKETHYPPFEGEYTDLEGSSALPGGFRVIPIATVDKNSDKIFMKGFSTMCPKAHQSSKILWQNRIKARSSDIKDFGDKLTGLGFKINEVYSWKKEWDIEAAGYFADDSLCYHSYYGEPMKKTEDIFDKIPYVFALYYFNEKYADPDITKLYITGLVNSVLQEFDDKIAGKSNLKYYGLSGHESNLVPLMLQYKLTTEECQAKKLKGEEVTEQCELSPKFAANFIWELSKNGEENFIKVLYNGKPVKTCLKQNEDGYCSYQNFKSYMVENFVLDKDEFQKVCDGKKKEKDDETENIWKWIGIGGSIIIFLVIVVALICITRGKETEAESEGENVLNHTMMEHSVYNFT